MSLIPVDILEKLKGGEIDKDDRLRLDLALVFCAAVIVGLLFWKPPVDAEIVKLAMSNAWIGAMVALVVYVFGMRVKRTPRAPAPAGTTINIGAPQEEQAPAVAEKKIEVIDKNVKKIKEKVKA